MDRFKTPHFYLLFFIISYSNAQEVNKYTSYSNDWFISSGYGLQISGIKSEDFIRSNITPSFLLNIGRWVSSEIALQIGYKGFYFHTISDKDKHYYNYIYGEVLFNINKLIKSKNSSNGYWELIFHSGAGYFYNNYYKRPNVCANIGLKNNFKVLNQLNFFIDISAIAGWDIYQSNEDILPSCDFGVTYLIQ